MDVTQLPGEQDADKKQYREPDTKRQCARHVVGFGFAIGAVPHHEKKRRGQAA